MSPSEILVKARRDTHLTTTQYSDADGIIDLNVVMKKVINRIISDVDENYFYEIWTTDAVAAQANGEYPLEIEDESGGTYVPGMVKVKSVWIQPVSTEVLSDGTTKKYVKCREVDPDQLSEEWGYYLVNQSVDDPIYFIADKSVFIAPQFAAADVGASPNAQIKLYGVKSLAEVTAATLETEMPIMDDFHEIFIRGVAAEIQRSRIKIGEKNDSLMEFNQLLEQLIIDLGNRVMGTHQAELPDDSSLQY